MSKPVPTVGRQQQNETRFEIHIHRSTQAGWTELSFTEHSELLEWIAGEVGPQALRRFVLDRLPGEQLTTQQSADLLGMSRPTLIKLIERGDLPHTMVGNRRYLPLAAVEDYRRRYETQLNESADRAPDEVIAKNLRFLQELAEEEGDFA
jgi:excisionase family DNA binding protein